MDAPAAFRPALDPLRRSAALLWRAPGLTFGSRLVFGSRPAFGPVMALSPCLTLFRSAMRASLGALPGRPLVHPRATAALGLRTTATAMFRRRAAATAPAMALAAAWGTAAALTAALVTAAAMTSAWTNSRQWGP
ncbi:hypothetical protein M8312_10155 [Sphingomonas sp. KRR8]|uniref:hypothetical protein n=1 Tax=Sphingomonas sp. KRR8 TaxID=2942996 RepID=UPI00201FE863|nr:hypothetical protein [Sphingomonas sp. KRR8]URD60148.1 hypothetical protein M8312_10155 [Sphingomonas sp. KRR8]